MIAPRSGFFISYYFLFSVVVRVYMYLLVFAINTARLGKCYPFLLHKTLRPAGRAHKQGRSGVFLAQAVSIPTALYPHPKTISSTFSASTTPLPLGQHAAPHS
jgi:hypothetical protein